MLQDMSSLEIMTAMDKLSLAANVLLSGQVTMFDQSMASPLMSKYHELAAEIKSRTSIDIRPDS